MSWWDITRETLSPDGRFEERQLQRKVIESLQCCFEKLSAKSSVIQPILIRLPCGYGKTIIGEIPFIAQLKTNNWLTRGSCYVLPTRALTKHHEDVIKSHVASVNKNMDVLAFHGEEHSANVFYADVAVSTFDTFTYAYARSSRTGHHLEFPAGTIATSHVVFDEAHMLRDDYAYTHSVMNSVLKILCKSGVPTIAMTATMPKPIEDIVFDGLEPLKIPDFTNYSEWGQISTLLKDEIYRGTVCEVELCEEIPSSIALHETFLRGLSGKRILIICNTVLSAQTVFNSLRKKLEQLHPSGEIILLHSRLTKKERNKREMLARTLMSRKKCAGECGKGEKSCVPFPFYLYSRANDNQVFCEDCAPQKQNLKRIDYVIIIATQIVEAGLDITSDILITECAPIDSLIQRVGRCARFGHESGFVKILYYENVWSPYPKNLVAETWKILKELNQRDRISALTDFTKYMPVLNKAYETFQRDLPTDELRWYLAYLEGSGFSTFTIDWRILKTIKARPNAPITLVVPDSSMLLYEAKEDPDYIKHRKTGRFRRYTLLSKKTFSYDDMLVHLLTLQKERKCLLIKCNRVNDYSLSIDLNYSIEKGKPKSFLLHKVAEEECLIELNLIRASSMTRKIMYFYLVSLTKNPLSEGTYLLNPEFYDSTVGLRIGDQK